MSPDLRVTRVMFVTASVEAALASLELGKFEDRELATNIREAVAVLKKDPFSGVNISKRLWPKEYIQKYAIDNLRKYNLRGGWRLLYFLKGNTLEIISIIIEWRSHPEYERLFKY